MSRSAGTTVFCCLMLQLLRLVLSTQLDIRSAYCDIYVDQACGPSILSSLVERRTLATSISSVKDCLLACFSKDACRTATFDSRAQMCAMYSAALGSPNPSLTGSAEMTTISIQNKNQCKLIYRCAVRVMSDAWRKSHVYSSSKMRNFDR